MKKIIAGLCLAATSMHTRAADVTLTSPDKKITVTIQVTQDLKWSVRYNNEVILQPSRLALELENGTVLGSSPVLLKQQRNTVNGAITAVVPVKRLHMPEHYNELRLLFKGNYSVCFRAYDNGVAYRFETALGKKEVHVKQETAEYRFSGNYRTFWPVETEHLSPTFQSHYEFAFRDTAVASIQDNIYAGLPVYLRTPGGARVVLTEADLHDYPNQFVFGTGGNALRAAFPPVILKDSIKGDRVTEILQQADYIAGTGGTRSYPWRTLIIAPDDKGLLENDLVYRLSTPNVIGHTEWIKPGKVAWDWWNANNVYGVNFRAGINTDTYKYYVDFAAAYGLEYIILDEGWTRTTLDITHSNPELDMPELLRYAQSRHVGVILWVLWNALDADMEHVLDLYASWGVKGIKVDFMARGEQYMVNFYERTAAACAKRQLLVDFHGAFKPVGLNRKYPNVISYEGVKGLENNKWSSVITPAHDVTLPFTRMVAGPMDYTPGAMRNAVQQNFRDIFTAPMSQGTRCHQAAMYALYESPLQMLADNPSSYQQEPEYTRFIAQFPTTWDTTIALYADAGHYLAVARRKGNTWYIGAMTDWQGRELDIPLNFLGAGSYQLEAVQDGVNADRHAADYAFQRQTVDRSAHVKIRMASGGGWAAVLKPM